MTKAEKQKVIKDETRDNYLKTIKLTMTENGCARACDIAKRLGVSKPTVSVHLRHLEDEGYIYRNEENRICLTRKGKVIANDISEKFLFFREILMSLDIDEQTAEEDACRMEHALSDKSFVSLKKYIGK